MVDEYQEIYKRVEEAIESCGYGDMRMPMVYHQGNYCVIEEEITWRNKVGDVVIGFHNEDPILSLIRGGVRNMTEVMPDMTVEDICQSIKRLEEEKNCFTDTDAMQVITDFTDADMRLVINDFYSKTKSNF